MPPDVRRLAPRADEVVLSGLTRAIEDGRTAFGVDGALILSFLQDRSLEEAMAMLEQALKPENIGKIIGVGMDNGLAGAPLHFEALIWSQESLC